MKKYFILLTALLLVGTNSLAAQTPSLSVAIQKYKGENYVGCIQDTQDITKKDPSNALAYYYMAISYASIGKKEDAISAYDKVIALATNETLLEYAQRGSSCMSDPEGCKKKEANIDNDLDRFIRSGESFSKSTTDKLREIQIQQMKDAINKEVDKAKTDSRSEVPTNDEIAEAVKVLARAGINPVAQNPYLQAQQAMYQNPEYMQLQMLMGNNSNNGNDFMNGMMPYFLAQQQNKDSKSNMSSDMIRSMMMSSMMGNINTTFDVGGNK